jgi:hypothetical protein
MKGHVFVSIASPLIDSNGLSAQARETLAWISALAILQVVKPLETVFTDYEEPVLALRKLYVPDVIADPMFVLFAVNLRIAMAYRGYPRIQPDEEGDAQYSVIDRLFLPDDFTNECFCCCNRRMLGKGHDVPRAPRVGPRRQ